MVSKSDLKKKVVCIVGLGYVGLPLAKAFSKHFEVIGFDINRKKLEYLQKDSGRLKLTSNPSEIKKADFVIIAVPTPVTIFKEPDLSYVKSVAKIVGKNLKKGATVVLESTVFPGVTEEIVGPILEKESGLQLSARDFKIGYSPERINPGDKKHTLENITKIVSGMDKKTTDELAALYGKITTTFKTSDIKTAEAAKVIENVQRDLNIALTNELAIIFNKIGLDTKSVLDAASTKWNFHRYQPGLIGGHCIPVDPYYFVYKAKELGYHPQVILAGRSINDHMPEYIANLTIKALIDVDQIVKGAKILIMGLTYKENVPDIRETPVKSLIKELKIFNVKIYGYDPLLPTKLIKSEFEINTFTGIETLNKKSKQNEQIDAVIIVVPHNDFKKITLSKLKRLCSANPVLIDVRRVYNKKEAEKIGFFYKTI